MNGQKTAVRVRNGETDKTLARLYGDAIDVSRERLAKLAEDFDALYGDATGEVSLFSAPGRSELSGNHTDHNHGRIIAGSIDLDVIAAAAATDDGIIRIKSEGYPEDCVDVNACSEPDPAKFGSSAALIAGVCEGFRRRGYRVGGLRACTTSSVLKGSGLSSSAAFEVMVGTLLNHLYNGGAVSAVTVAQIAQFAENEFFGKPCGLMDQLACAVGGVIEVDFRDPASPMIEKLDFSPVMNAFRLCITDTHGDHADLTSDYAAIPAEMKAVAAYFGKQYLRELRSSDVIAALPELRRAVGDRAVLRALHFFEENHRVKEQADALRDGDVTRFLALVAESGRSSAEYLQNAYADSQSSRSIPLALFLSEKLLRGSDGVCRLHGGGFAGTVQAYVPKKICTDYAAAMDAAFGAGSCHVLSVRPDGAVRIC